MVFLSIPLSWKQSYKSFIAKNNSRYLISNLARKRLLKIFRHKVFLRLTISNSMVSTKIPGTLSNYNLSIGQRSDFKQNKKRKRTYMAGFELGLLLGRVMRSHQVRSLSMYHKGTTAARDGFYQAIVQEHINVTRIYIRTPVAHNGTRGTGKRRL